MSRGGRGGGRGGRGQIPGDGYDADLKPFTKPSELFPAYRVPVAELPTERERRAVSFYIGLREQIHEGPLYTKARTRDTSRPFKTYGEDHFNSVHEIGSKATFDAFDGVPRYAHKYQQKKRFIPQFSGRSFPKELFPEELHSTVEGEEGEAVRNQINKALKRKAALISNSDPQQNVTPEERAKLLEEKLKNLENDDVGGEVEGEDDDENAQEEELDYDYEEDEDEMGGDYAAEQYFDDGAGEEDDGEGGGGDYD